MLFIEMSSTSIPFLHFQSITVKEWRVCYSEIHAIMLTLADDSLKVKGELREKIIRSE